MILTPVGGTATAAATSGQTSNSGQGLSGLGGEEFLTLLIAQIRNQNPLEPLAADEFLNQTAQLSTVENLGRLNTNITQLLGLQELTQAAGLIGKEVSYVKAGKTELQKGVVSAVNVVNGNVALSAGADTVELSQVRAIKAA